MLLALETLSETARGALELLLAPLFAEGSILVGGGLRALFAVGLTFADDVDDPDVLVLVRARVLLRVGLVWLPRLLGRPTSELTSTTGFA